MSDTIPTVFDGNTKMICNKDNIILRRNEELNTFSLTFRLKNEKIQLSKIINLKLYTLLYELNKDIIENVEILSETETESTILLIFRQFGAELGMSQKYMCLHTVMDADIEQGSIIMRSETATSGRDNLKGISNCEEIISPYTNLFVTMKSETEAIIDYIFNMEMDDELPIYMENMIGVLMKKTLLRVKEFIEKI
tara:strand:+ start:276 stop:860 length:585 start_codon:yes stop_codon:yes gene_type:complete